MTQSFDLVVVGGGINGLAIARDAALRGLSVLLAERDDIGGKTSARSSRMIHGGLRYLEYFEFSLVRESLRERENLLRNAPHLVKPVRLLIPHYEHSTRPRWKIRIGMLLYDLLSFDRSTQGHTSLSRSETHLRVPSLNKAGLRGAVEYTDAQVEYSERLCVEMARDAISAGAVILNHTRVTGFDRKNGQICGVLTEGENKGSNNYFSCSTVVNASGPWVNEFLENTGIAGPKLVGGTKGSHIILPNFPGASDIVVHFESIDGKPFFCMPWDNCILMGSTDTFSNENFETLRISNSEKRELLDAVNLVFPTAQLAEQDIITSYSGWRPLPAEDTEDAESVSRSHSIHRHDSVDCSNLYSIIGGKLTTHRSLAEQTVTKLLSDHFTPRPCVTQQRRYPGWIDDSEYEEQYQTLVSEGAESRIASHLLHRYGGLAREVINTAENDKELLRPLIDGAPFVGAEVLNGISNEFAQTLEDVIFRRMVAGYGGDIIPLANAAANLVKEKLGWDQARINKDLDQINRAYDLLIP